MPRTLSEQGEGREPQLPRQSGQELRDKGEGGREEAGGGAGVRPYLDGIKRGHGVNHQASRLCRGGKQKSKSNQVSVN